jgi:hypothetical protein
MARGAGSGDGRLGQVAPREHDCGMARLYLVFVALQVALAVAALISCLSTEEEDIKALPRLVWVLIILFFPLVGSISWFLAGRIRRTTTGGPPTGTTRRGVGGRGRPRPLAPDDDPDFLRSLKPRPEERDDDQPKS